VPFGATIALACGVLAYGLTKHLSGDAAAFDEPLFQFSAFFIEWCVPIFVFFWIAKRIVSSISSYR
jgi:hypothetical protein